jgi:hypothetical protein
VDINVNKGTKFTKINDRIFPLKDFILSNETVTMVLKPNFGKLFLSLSRATCQSHGLLERG